MSFLHPQLWPALVGAVLGFILIAWASGWLALRWERWTARKRWVVAIAIGLIETLYWANIYAWFIEPRFLHESRVEIVSEHWRGAPIKIALIADTHVGGPHVDAARVGRVVARVNAIRPDLVVLLGDYVAGHAPRAEQNERAQWEVAGGIAAFAALNAPLGAVGVLGNHDAWYDANAVAGALEDAGVAVLRNRNVVIGRERGDIVIAGLEDYDTGAPDYAAAIDGAPEGADLLVIAHSPDVMPQIPAGPALVLAAHSHCGQVRLPLIGPLIVPLDNRRYACGLIREEGKTLYVTGGVGTSILPLRFLTPPEIVLVTLRGAD